MKRLTVLILALLAALLAACGDSVPIVGVFGATSSPTECNCDLVDPSGTPVSTPEGGFSISAPAGPGADVTSTPAPVESFRDRWTTYANPAYGFSFDYPAVYDSRQYRYCAPRAQQSTSPADDPRVASRAQLQRAEAAIAEFRGRVRADLRTHVARGGELRADTVDALQSALTAAADALGAALRR